MKKIKFINSTTIKLIHTIYKGYPVGELPKRFAFIYDEDKDQEGITQWFNYKGLTFVEKTENPFAI
jgi:hypothetical protein